MTSDPPIDNRVALYRQDGNMIAAHEPCKMVALPISADWGRGTARENARLLLGLSGEATWSFRFDPAGLAEAHQNDGCPKIARILQHF